MQVVFLLSLDKHFGGGDYSIYKFAEAFSRLGHQVFIFYSGNHLIVNSTHSPNLKIFNKINIGINFKGKGRINSVITSFYDKTVLSPFLAKNKKNLDFIFGYQRDEAIKAVKFGQRYQIRTVNFNFETPQWLMEKSPSWKKIYEKDGLLRDSWHAYKQALEKSDLVVANSELTGQETKKWIGREVDLVLYPGIDSENAEKLSVKKEHQIIYVGRLEENKNIHEIMQALALLGSDVKLLICGSGSLGKELRVFAGKTYKHVVFRDKVSEKEKWEEIQKSLLMVFPSSFEGFGMPPMEALLMGVPCLCSDIPILKEVYENSVDYFKEHNVKDLSQKLGLLLSDPSRRETLGWEGQKFVMKKFGWDKSAKKLESTLSQYQVNFPEKNGS